MTIKEKQNPKKKINLHPPPNWAYFHAEVDFDILNF